MRLQKLLGTRLSLAGGLLCAVLAITVLTAVAHPRKAGATPAPTSFQELNDMTLRLIDRATVEGKVGDRTYIFYDRNIDDNNYMYELLDPDCGGDHFLNFGTGLESGNASLKMQVRTEGVGTCSYSPEILVSKTVTGLDKAAVYFAKTSATTIARVDGNKSFIYEQDAASPNGNIYIKTTGEGRCKDVLIKNGDSVLIMDLDLKNDSQFDPPNSNELGPEMTQYLNTNRPGCNVWYRYGKGFLGLSATANNPSAGNATGGGTAAEDAPSCENNTSWSLNWLVCPLIEGIQAAVDKLADSIGELLEIDAKYYDNQSLKESWSNINRIATFGLVAAGLIMVISTALGFSFVDAYTLRKILPRIIIAAIGMQLSWYIMGFLIQSINDIGKGIADLMYAPFQGEAHVDLLAALDKSGIIGGGGSNGLFLVATVGALGIAGLTILFSLAATSLGVILVAFLILLVRRLVIITLIVMAPIAIVSSILPNTDGFWKFWRKAFVDLLLMYPLIMMLIAGGKIFAYIAAGTPDTGNIGIPGSSAGTALLDNFVIIGAIAIGHFGVLAGVPFIASRIGGFVGNITGMVNNRSKGFFDRQSKARSENWKNRKELAGSNQLYNRGGNFKLRPGGKQRNLGSGMNAAASWMASPIGNARYKIGEKARGSDGVPDSGAARLAARLGGSVYTDVDAKIGSSTDKLAQLLLSKGVVVDKAHLALAGVMDDKPPVDENGNLKLDDNGNPIMTEGIALKEALIGKDGKGKIMSTKEYETYRKTGVTSDATLAKLRQGLASVDDEEFAPRFQDAASQLGNIQGQIGEFHKSTEYGKGSMKMASAYVAASQGFMDPDQIASVANDMRDQGMSQSVTSIWAGKTSAAAFGKGVLEAKATYGVRQTAEGKYYNAMSSKAFVDAQKVISDPAYSSAAADSAEGKQYRQAKTIIKNQVDLVSSLKGSDWATIKGDKRIRNFEPVLEYVLQGNVGTTTTEKTASASQMRSNLEYMTDYGNADVKSRAAMQKILESVPAPEGYKSRTGRNDAAIVSATQQAQAFQEAMDQAAQDRSNEDNNGQH